ncbi:MAG: TIGR04255 family protein [Proteobacteria bacterium]|nr:TIGR04255 family protein [Pseudomonadota bacterium]
MGLSFKNSPLVEIIAEMRWDLPWVNQSSVQDIGSVVPMSSTLANQHEEFYMRFGSKVAAAGYQRIERLVPPNFSQLPYHPVYRFRHNAENKDKGARLYQLGAGLFSVNATPPYKSWAEFEPMVSVGVDALLQSRADNEKSNIFKSISLRYIDAFKKELTDGRSIAEFMDALGFQIKTPDAIIRHASNVAEIQPFLQLTVPVAIGQLNISIADGAVSNEPAIIMDTIASNTAEIGCSKEEVMAAFEQTHSLILSMFFDLTKPLHEHMQPEGSGQC